jgi:hypothetical protein
MIIFSNVYLPSSSRRLFDYYLKAGTAENQTIWFTVTVALTIFAGVTLSSAG